MALTPTRRHAAVDGDLRARNAARFFLLATVVLALWIPGLALTLPASHTTRHWNVAWVGFDVLLFVGLAHVAWLAHRRSPLLALPAMATAALLVVDAWFDVTTSAAGRDQLIAIVLALSGELPVAGLCLSIAWRALRSLRPVTFAGR
jgi:hypothetical protein